MKFGIFWILKLYEKTNTFYPLIILSFSHDTEVMRYIQNPILAIFMSDTDKWLSDVLKVARELCSAQPARHWNYFTTIFPSSSSPIKSKPTAFEYLSRVSSSVVMKLLLTLEFYSKLKPLESTMQMCFKVCWSDVAAKQTYLWCTRQTRFGHLQLTEAYYKFLDSSELWRPYWSIYQDLLLQYRP